MLSHIRRIMRTSHRPWRNDLLTFDQSIRGLQQQRAWLRMASFNALDRHLQCQQRSPHLQYGQRWISQPTFLLELDPCEFIRGISQFGRIALEVVEHACKHDAKIHLQRIRWEVVAAGDFRKVRGHPAPAFPGRSSHRNNTLELIADGPARQSVELWKTSM